MTIKQTFLITSLATFVCCSAWAERAVDERISMRSDGRVSISNIAGSVTVSGWDRSEVEVSGELSEGVDRVDVDSDGRNIVIEVVHKDHPKREKRWNWSSEDKDADLTIRVPRLAQLEVDTTSADIDIRDHTGAQQVKSVSGEIELTLSEVEASVKSISGSIEARGRDVSIEAQLESVSGDIELLGFRGDLESETVSGDIEIRDSRLRDGEFESVSGDIDLRLRLASSGRLDMETVSGDVSIEFDGVIDATVRVDSHSGDIDDFFGVEAERTSRFGPGRRLRASTGEGGADVSISTLSGNVRNRTRD